MDRGLVAKTAYPDSLLNRERELLALRRRAAALDAPPTDGRTPGRLGFALSGGGIRSATFCLGVFQALAGQHRLGAIDYVSSVSGGGYFASFFGRLFTRKGIGIAEVEQILSPIAAVRARELASDHAVTDPKYSHWTGRVFDWLRQNGRYLAPNGGGDLTIGLAVAARNWAIIQVFIAIPILWFFLSLRIIASFPVCTGLQACSLIEKFGPFWSPYLSWAALLFLFLAWPLGWAYWLMPPARRTWRDTTPWLTAIFVIVVASAILLRDTEGVPTWLAEIAILVGMETVVFATLYIVCSQRIDQPQAPQGRDATPDLTEADARILDSETSRSRISAHFRTAFIIFLLVLLLGLIDSAGQWIYFNAHCASQFPVRLTKVFATVTAVSAAVAPAARWIVANLGSKKRDQRPSISLNLIATAAAILLLAVITVAADVSAEIIRSALNGYTLAGWLVVTVLIPLSGWTWSFVNNSSLHALYAGRLIRAYLGASNWTRLADDSPGLSAVVPGDDISQERYWGDAQNGQVKRGAPLHLVNVTLNETVDGQTQIEQRDRKGLALAAGPSGLSVGVQHHLLLDCIVGQYRIAGIEPGKTAGFRVFEYPDVEDEARENMSLGKWTAISGAAVATGLGSRTSLGISLLTGLFNVRLGYWWDSGVRPMQRKVTAARSIGRTIGAVINWLLPAQTYLLDEFMGRFHGTARRYWYLTDGGHFENMGAYELIRRRLPLIVVIDAEGDPDYSFPGMAALVRKARLDFGAEITFLDENELDAALRTKVRQHFGALEQLRRGTWSSEPVEGPGTSHQRLSVDPDETGLSLAHAALGKIFYDGRDEPESWLLLIKPTLTGDEPEDVLRYHSDHPAFPHESTGEQFFNEAQWESYRRLGEHIMSLILDGLDDRDGPLFSSLLRA
jgi:hypothetical protein